MAAFVDELGKRFGRLRVVCRSAPVTNSAKKTGGAYWWCACDCGELISTRAIGLRRGDTKSCGCANLDTLRARFKDETGKRYGSRVVLGKVDRFGSGAWWSVRCDCGTESEVDGGSLRRGGSDTCGCSLSTRGASPLPEGAAARNLALSGIKANAAKRGYRWDVTDEHAYELMARNCHYCDAPPSNLTGRHKRSGTFAYSGLDRVDNSRGYEANNVVACCVHCNLAKRARTKDEFLAWAARLYAHSSRGDGEQN